MKYQDIIIQIDNKLYINLNKTIKFLKDFKIVNKTILNFKEKYNS